MSTEIKRTLCGTDLKKVYGTREVVKGITINGLITLLNNSLGEGVKYSLALTLFLINAS